MGSQPVRAVAWVCLYKELPYKFKSISPTDPRKEKDKYRVINPMARVPSIVDDGFALYESPAIMMYLATVEFTSPHTALPGMFVRL